MMTTITRPPAASGIGWSNGMASQVSLPNMLFPRPRRDARIRPTFVRAWSRRKFLRCDLLEQRCLDRAECHRRRENALPGKFGIAVGIERRTAALSGLHPGGELIRWHRVHIEMH